MAWDRWNSDHATAADHANPAQVALGHSLYDQHCAFCHGADLAGKPGWDGDYPAGGRPAVPLDGSGAVARLGDRDLDRKSVVSGKSVSVRVDLGGRRIIKKKNSQFAKLHRRYT